jgi:hypothetical protein
MKRTNFFENLRGIWKLERKRMNYLKKEDETLNGSLP